MKKSKLMALLCLLLIALTWVNKPKVSASSVNDGTPDLPVSDGIPLLPEEVCERKPKATARIQSPEGALNEVDDFEGDNPVYVLVFGDEEERSCYRYFPGDETPVPIRSWQMWAKCQIERGDEALVSNFGIDIRILGFVNWDSDDSKTTLYDLLYELYSETYGYIGQWWDGEYWSNYVDAIIGITGQSVSDAAGYSFVGGRVLIVKWQVYWADDNLVQHEISHWYGVNNHEPNCCVMAQHTHFVGALWEDGLWVILWWIRCVYTSYSWCTTCYNIIWSNRAKFGSDLTKNPSFETGDESYWTIGGHGDHMVTSEDRHSGSYSLLLGFKYKPNVIDGRDYAYQLITIPSGAAKAKLVFWYHMFTEDYEPYNWFEVYVAPLGGDPVLKFKKAGTPPADLEEFGWERVTIDISAYAGKSIYLYFNVINQIDLAFKTWCYIDDIYVAY